MDFVGFNNNHTKYKDMPEFLAFSLFSAGFIRILCVSTTIQAWSKCFLEPGSILKLDRLMSYISSYVTLRINKEGFEKANHHLKWCFLGRTSDQCNFVSRKNPRSS